MNLSDEIGWSPLTTAIYFRKIELVSLLIEEGADVNKKNEDGWLPINLVVGNEAKDILKLLIESGADLNLSDKTRCTPLTFSIYGRKMEIISMLIEKYPNKLGRIAPVILWFADRFKKELIFKTAYVLSLLQKYWV